MAKEILVSNRQGTGMSHEIRIGGDGQQLGASGGDYGAAGASYKSVLLCDRPAPLPTGKSSGKSLAFVSSVKTKEMLGLPPARDLVSGSIYEYTKPTLHANIQHRKWLRALSRLKSKIQADQEQQAVLSKSRKLRFRKRLARLRQAVRSRADEDADDTEAQGDTSQLNVSLSPRLSGALEASLGNEVETKQMVSSKSKSKSRSKAKPMWAMTSEEVNAHETAEADDLLDFASNLDFDRYISDLEVQSTLRVLLNRVYELEQKTNSSQDTPATAIVVPDLVFDDGASVASAVMKGAQLDTGRWKGRFLSAWKELPENQRAVLRRHFRSEESSELALKEAGWDAAVGNDDNKSVLARKILGGSETIRSVHSEASVRQIIEKMQQK